MISFAKGSTCGYVPLGGVVVNKKIADHFDNNVMLCGLTYSAHPVGCAAAIATIGEYKRLKIADNVKAVGKVLAVELDKICEKHACVGEVRHIGLFSAVELVKDKATREALVPFGNDAEGLMGKIVGMLKKEGFSTYSHENMIIVAPPLIITEKELLEALAILDKVLDSVDNMIK
jgi:taurine--2-oxoglutarate transaminase